MTKNSLISNLSWKFAERISAQLVSMIVSVILARLLDPAHYGLIAMVIVFITLANILVSDGLASALIQKKDTDMLDYSSFLYFNVVVAVILYGILFLAAPYMTVFYGEGYEILTPVLRVLGLRVPLTAVSSVQHAYISKKMLFGKFFWATLVGTVTSAVVGITMAYYGFGVWALVAQQLVSNTVNILTLAIIVGKLPAFAFSFQRIRTMMGYGIKILGSGLLNTGFQEFRTIIVAKFYSSADLAFYDKGAYFPKLIIGNINSAVTAVLFPKMANEQDDIEKVKQMTRQSIRFGSFLLFPMMLGMASVARPFVIVLLTEKWLPCVPLLQMFCIFYLFQPVHSANMQAIKALGKGSTYLRLEAIKKVIELITLLITIGISIEAVVIGMTVLATLFTVVNAIPNVKYLNYMIKEQMLDMLPALLRSVAMVLVVIGIGLIPMSELLRLIVQILSGIVTYILLAGLTRSKELRYLLQLLKRR